MARSTQVGAAYVYQLNRDHLIATAVIQIANTKRELLRRVEDRLANWEVSPEYAAVFGSAARGTMTTDSDIDLFLLRDDDAPHTLWDEQVRSLAADITAWTGNDTRPLEWAISELDTLWDEPVIRAILHEGLTVAGSRAWLSAQIRKRSNRAAAVTGQPADFAPDPGFIAKTFFIAKDLHAHSVHFLRDKKILRDHRAA